LAPQSCARPLTIDAMAAGDSDHRSHHRPAPFARDALVDRQTTITSRASNFKQLPGSSMVLGPKTPSGKEGEHGRNIANLVVVWRCGRFLFLFLPPSWSTRPRCCPSMTLIFSTLLRTTCEIYIYPFFSDPRTSVLLSLTSLEHHPFYGFP